ncbi:hypothetical protein LguiB_027898 [Lonicera macranthoides]
MAGRAIDNLYIDCNDDGIPYVQARSTCLLSVIISDPVLNQLNEFFPCKLNEVTDLSLVIKVTSFTYAGLALAVGISDKIDDALSSFLLINCWVALACGENNILCPKFESAKLFPPKDMSGFKAGIGIAKEKIVTKRFVISASKIAILRGRLAVVILSMEKEEECNYCIMNQMRDAIINIDGGPGFHYMKRILDGESLNGSDRLALSSRI